MVVDREFGDIYFVPSTSFRGPLSPFMLTFVRSWLHLGALGADFVHFGAHVAPFGMP